MAYGIEPVMLTGDSQDVAKAVAEELGIKRYFAQVLPEDKDKKVSELQAEGKSVAMVGDGVNDAPALTRADVGIAIGSGTDVAIESAGLILVQSNPMDVVNIITLSKATYRKMIQNFDLGDGLQCGRVAVGCRCIGSLGHLAVTSGRGIIYVFEHSGGSDQCAIAAEYGT